MGRIVALVDVSTRVALYYRASTATQATENQRLAPPMSDPIAITSGVAVGLSHCVTAACEARRRRRVSGAAGGGEDQHFQNADQRRGGAREPSIHSHECLRGDRPTSALVRTLTEVRKWRVTPRGRSISIVTTDYGLLWQNPRDAQCAGNRAFENRRRHGTAGWRSPGVVTQLRRAPGGHETGSAGGA